MLYSSVRLLVAGKEVAYKELSYTENNLVAVIEQDVATSHNLLTILHYEALPVQVLVQDPTQPDDDLLNYIVQFDGLAYKSTIITSPLSSASVVRLAAAPTLQYILSKIKYTFISAGTILNRNIGELQHYAKTNAVKEQNLKSNVVSLPDMQSTAYNIFLYKKVGVNITSVKRPHDFYESMLNTLLLPLTEAASLPTLFDRTEQLKETFRGKHNVLLSQKSVEKIIRDASEGGEESELKQTNTFPRTPIQIIMSGLAKDATLHQHLDKALNTMHTNAPDVFEKTMLGSYLGTGKKRLETWLEVKGYAFLKPIVENYFATLIDLVGIGLLTASFRSAYVKVVLENYDGKKRNSPVGAYLLSLKRFSDAYVTSSTSIGAIVTIIVQQAEASIEELLTAHYLSIYAADDVVYKDKIRKYVINPIISFIRAGVGLGGTIPPKTQLESIKDSMEDMNKRVASVDSVSHNIFLFPTLRELYEKTNEIALNDTFSNTEGTDYLFLTSRSYVKANLKHKNQYYMSMSFLSTVYEELYTIANVADSFIAGLLRSDKIIEARDETGAITGMFSIIFTEKSAKQDNTKAGAWGDKAQLYATVLTWYKTQHLLNTKDSIEDVARTTKQADLSHLKKYDFYIARKLDIIQAQKRIGTFDIFKWYLPTRTESHNDIVFPTLNKLHENMILNLVKTAGGGRSAKYNDKTLLSILMSLYMSIGYKMYNVLNKTVFENRSLAVKPTGVLGKVVVNKGLYAPEMFVSPAYPHFAPPFCNVFVGEDIENATEKLDGEGKNLYLFQVRPQLPGISNKNLPKKVYTFDILAGDSELKEVFDSDLFGTNTRIENSEVSLLEDKVFGLNNIVEFDLTATVAKMLKKTHDKKNKTETNVGAHAIDQLDELLNKNLNFGVYTGLYLTDEQINKAEITLTIVEDKQYEPKQFSDLIGTSIDAKEEAYHLKENNVSFVNAMEAPLFKDMKLDKANYTTNSSENATVIELPLGINTTAMKVVNNNVSSNVVEGDTIKTSIKIAATAPSKDVLTLLTDQSKRVALSTLIQNKIDLGATPGVTATAVRNLLGQVITVYADVLIGNTVYGMLNKYAKALKSAKLLSTDAIAELQQFVAATKRLLSAKDAIHYTINLVNNTLTVSLSLTSAEQISTKIEAIALHELQSLLSQATITVYNVTTISKYLVGETTRVLYESFIDSSGRTYDLYRAYLLREKYPPEVSSSYSVLIDDKATHYPVYSFGINTRNLNECHVAYTTEQHLLEQSVAGRAPYNGEFSPITRRLFAVGDDTPTNITILSNTEESFLNSYISKHSKITQLMSLMNANSEVWGYIWLPYAQIIDNVVENFIYTTAIAGAQLVDGALNTVIDAIGRAAAAKLKETIIAKRQKLLDEHTTIQPTATIHKDNDWWFNAGASGLYVINPTSDQDSRRAFLAKRYSNHEFTHYHTGYDILLINGKKKVRDIYDSPKALEKFAQYAVLRATNDEYVEPVAPYIVAPEDGYAVCSLYKGFGVTVKFVPENRRHDKDIIPVFLFGHCHPLSPLTNNGLESRIEYRDKVLLKTMPGSVVNILKPLSSIADVATDTTYITPYHKQTLADYKKVWQRTASNTYGDFLNRYLHYYMIFNKKGRAIIDKALRRVHTHIGDVLTKITYRRVRSGEPIAIVGHSGSSRNGAKKQNGFAAHAHVQIFKLRTSTSAEVNEKSALTLLTVHADKKMREVQGDIRNAEALTTELYNPLPFIVGIDTQLDEISKVTSSEDGDATAKPAANTGSGITLEEYEDKDWRKYIEFDALSKIIETQYTTGIPAITLPYIDINASQYYPAAYVSKSDIYLTQITSIRCHVAGETDKATSVISFSKGMSVRGLWLIMRSRLERSIRVEHKLNSTDPLTDSRVLGDARYLVDLLSNFIKTPFLQPNVSDIKETLHDIEKVTAEYAHVFGRDNFAFNWTDYVKFSVKVLNTYITISIDELINLVGNGGISKKEFARVVVEEILGPQTIPRVLDKADPFFSIDINRVQEGELANDLVGEREQLLFTKKSWGLYHYLTLSRMMQIELYHKQTISLVNNDEAVLHVSNKGYTQTVLNKDAFSYVDLVYDKTFSFYDWSRFIEQRQ